MLCDGSEVITRNEVGILAIFSTYTSLLSRRSYTALQVIEEEAELEDFV